MFHMRSQDKQGTWGESQGKKKDRSLTPEPSPIQLRDRNRSNGMIAATWRKSRSFSANFSTGVGKMSKKQTVCGAPKLEKSKGCNCK